MKSVSVIKDELTQLIQEQINIRRQMISECVGTLYPGIMEDEIDKLSRCKVKIRDIL